MIEYLRQHADQLNQYERDYLEQCERRVKSGFVFPADAAWIESVTAKLEERIAMATTTKSRKAKPEEVAKEKTLICSLKGASRGKNGRSLGFSFTRDMSPNQVMDLLCGASLSVKLIPKKDVEGQEPMFDEKHELEFNAECKSVNTYSDHYSGKLAIHVDAVDVKELERFAFVDAKIRFERVGDSKPESEEDKGGDDPTE